MIKSFIFSLTQVFSKPSYIVLSVFTFFTVITLAIWLPNINFLAHTAVSDTFTFSQKVGIIGSVFGSIQTNFTPLSQVTTILIAFIFAVNLSFFIYFFLRAAKLSKEAGIGTAGFLIALVGLGCASCGSVIISSLLGIGATAAFVGALPLKGAEFGLLSILLLSFSIYLLSKKINDPMICDAKPATFRFLLRKVPVWAVVAAIIFLAFGMGVFVANKSLSGVGIAGEALAAKFEMLSQSGNSSCSGDFKDSISEMQEGARLQGSCCSPMDLHRYSEQVEGLRKYANIKEIPPDPYDIEAGLAKKLMGYYDVQLSDEQQKEYDYAMENSAEKGPCCCKCWRWYVYGGLAKYLIQNYNFSGEQVTEVWNLSDGCGGEGDHVNH